MKKVLLIMAAAVMSASVSFAQVDDKAAAKAAKEAAKALKAEIKAATKVLREAQGQLNSPEGNIEQANALIEAAMENKHTASNPDTWYTAGKIQNKIYDAENEKMYLQQPYDQEVFFGSLSKMFNYFIKHIIAGVEAVCPRTAHVRISTIIKILTSGNTTATWI